MTEQNKLDSWEGYISNFLSADDVESEQDAFVCISVENFVQDDIDKIRTTLERNGKRWTFDLNITNTVFVKNSGLKSPNELVGSKLYFKKVLAYSPTKKKEVESLRISKVVTLV